MHLFYRLSALIGELLLAEFICFAFIATVHEFGHYVPARITGMRVGFLSLGLGSFGRPIIGSDPKKRFHVNPRVDLEFEDFRSFRQYAFVIATGPICTTLVGLGTMYWAPVSLKSLVWQADYYVSFPGQDLPSFTTLLILLIAYLGIADIINILPWRLGSKVWPDGYRLKLGWRASRKAGPFKAPSMAAAAQEQQNHDSNNEAQA